MNTELREKFECEFLGLDPRTAKIVNPFDKRSQEDIEEPHLHVLRLMKDPNNVFFTCKALMNRPGGRPLELFPFQCAIIRELWYRPLPMLIGSRGLGKSYLLALYALLRATFMQGRKVVIVGSGFRQAKGVFQYAETIWNNSPVFRSLFAESTSSGPRHDSDRWTLRLGDSMVTALPLGDGTAIRGERANDLLVDEFGCLGEGTLIDTPDGLRRIEGTIGESDLCVHDGDGDVRKVERFIRTPPTTAYRIRTVGNYEFVCSGIHRVSTNDGWKLAKELGEGDMLEMPQPPPFPERYIEGVDVNAGRLLGILVSEGSARTTAHDKSIPWSILQSPRPVVISFLSGLFEGDGSAFLWTDRAVENKLGVAFYSVSEQLCREVQVVLRKLGYFCSRRRRRSKLGDKWQWMLRLNGGHALRLAEELAIPKWRSIIDASERSHNRDEDDGVVWDKSGSKWQSRVHVKGMRKFIGRFAAEYGAKEAVATVRELESDYLRVVVVEELPGRQILYDYYIPPDHSFMGNGFRQHNSVPWEIYETSVKPFTAVDMDPMGAARRRAEIRVLKREGLWTDEMSEHERTRTIGNQSIISGTAYYQFNHFYDYWKRWKTIIESRGDNNTLKNAFPGGVADNIDHRDYSIIRIPYGLIPEGFLSDTIVNDARATYNTSVFLNEYQSVFASDSNGFFKRSLIETCVTKQPIEPETSPGEWVQFRATTKGDMNGHYIYGVDPAFSSDRFSIVVLEVHPTHRRIVYCWTTNAKDHRDRLKAGLTKSEDFYGFCSRKIRDLMKVFPCEHIALDSQGGGTAVAEALHDSEKMQPNEKPIWTITADHPLSDKKERESDTLPGLHLIELVNFAQADYVRESNHGMRKDFEDRVLLFPQYDPAILAIAMHDDQAKGRVFDTLEDAVSEIEELKEELSTIVYEQTPNSLRDRWDTPEVKIAGSRKGRLRKDRYSALLMANAAARRLGRQLEQPEMYPLGGFVHATTYVNPPASQSSRLYANAPDWFMDGVQGNQRAYGWAVNRPGVRD